MYEMKAINKNNTTKFVQDVIKEPMVFNNFKIDQSIITHC